MVKEKLLFEYSSVDLLWWDFNRIPNAYEAGWISLNNWQQVSMLPIMEAFSLSDQEVFQIVIMITSKADHFVLLVRSYITVNYFLLHLKIWGVRHFDGNVSSYSCCFRLMFEG